jgi:hypothetical protein
MKIPGISMIEFGSHVSKFFLDERCDADETYILTRDMCHQLLDSRLRSTNAVALPHGVEEASPFMVGLAPVGIMDPYGERGFAPHSRNSGVQILGFPKSVFRGGGVTGEAAEADLSGKICFPTGNHWNPIPLSADLGKEMTPETRMYLEEVLTEMRKDEESALYPKVIANHNGAVAELGDTSVPFTMDVFGEGGDIREFYVSHLATDYDIISHHRPNDRLYDQSPMVKELFALMVVSVKLEPHVITVGAACSDEWNGLLPQVESVITRHLDPQFNERARRELEESKRWDAPIDTMDFKMESGTVRAMGNSVFVSVGSKEDIEPETTQNEEA